MSKRKAKIHENRCTFCDRKATTRDHIPPAGIFPHPRPKNLIRVPACQRCNGSTKLDDEYFRLVVASAFGQSESANRIIQNKIIPKATTHPALLSQLLESTYDVDLTTPSGLYCGKGKAFEYDSERIQRVIEKIVKGLLWKRASTRLNRNYVVAPFILNWQPYDTQIERAVASLPLISIGKDEFSFRYYIDPDDRNASMWWLMFYDKTLFFTMTADPIAIEIAAAANEADPETNA